MINIEHLRKNKIKTGRNADVVKFIESLYDSSAEMFLKQHKDWYINDRFVRGDHWIVYNKTLGKLEPIPIREGEVRRTINKIRSQLRGVKNFIKRSQPRWEVHPEGADDAAFDVAKKKNKILQYIYRKTKIKQKMTDLVINSLKYSVGIMEGGIVKKNGVDTIDFWVDSTYDIMPDPYANDLQSCRYIFKTFVKPVEAVVGNKDYNAEDEHLADDREAASDYKNILEGEKYNKQGANSNEDLDTTVVKELWIKWVEKDETKVKVITIAGNNVLREYTPKYRRYPFFSYTPERSGDSFYGEPWIKDLISINKSLDKMTSQVEAYAQRMLAGKWLIKQGVEVSTVTDKGAEKIYYKGSTPPKQMELQPLPSTPLTHITNLERWIEELGGVRDASLGRASGSVQSGKGLEALQSADAGTVAEPIENLEVFLTEVADFTLELIADFSVASESIVEDSEAIKFVGAGAEAGLDDAVEITGNEEVRVAIVPEIAYSETEKRDWLFRLAEAKLIDEQTLLEQFNFSNVSDIIERMAFRKEEEFKQDMIKQKESHRTDGNGPEDSASLADQENMQMAAGQQVPATPKALWVPEHTQLHLSFIQENSDAYQQNTELYDNHITQEEQYGV